MAKVTRRGLLTMSTGYLAAGLSIAFLPVKTTLAWDRKTGYAIYKKTLKSTGSKEKALKAAAKFYRIFGLVFTLIGACLGLGTLLNGSSLNSLPEERRDN